MPHDREIKEEFTIYFKEQKLVISGIGLTVNNALLFLKKPICYTCKFSEMDWKFSKFKSI